MFKTHFSSHFNLVRRFGQIGSVLLELACIICLCFLLWFTCFTVSLAVLVFVCLVCPYLLAMCVFVCWHFLFCLLFLYFISWIHFDSDCSETLGICRSLCHLWLVKSATSKASFFLYKNVCTCTKYYVCFCILILFAFFGVVVVACCCCWCRIIQCLSFKINVCILFSASLL